MPINSLPLDPTKPYLQSDEDVVIVGVGSVTTIEGPIQDIPEKEPIGFKPPKREPRKKKNVPTDDPID
jgi:hypothetical protein